jgi:hypothetical protein
MMTSLPAHCNKSLFFILQDENDVDEVAAYFVALTLLFFIKRR